MIPRATACALVAADYAGGSTYASWRRISDLDLDGCTATLWTNEEQVGAVVTGSNDGWDWSRNLMFLPGYSGKGDSGRLYHRGILDYARRVYGWLLGKEIDWLAGHSLGGGIGEIVGSSLAIPTVTMAAPKVLLPFQSQPPGSGYVTNHMLPGDPVPWLVPCYAHIGARSYLEPSSGTWGMRHGIEHYIRAGAN